ncbi:efflux RND transporter periplasmic adaptor subunit [Ramlibacter sp. 2FC]|uniref:efflux RND transporter periplasmic adaptor subunit n=1 Tax=Ramlibacter sp. 2FC TaxID=2502188 RepID=UPI0010F6929C|nr:efflux RND transporter periplasmic adaptor subunit [Ramlibacter sp. 2FC]
MPVRYLCFASRRALALAFGGLALLLLAACSKSPPPEEPLRAVKLLTVGASPLEAGPEYAGEVRARVESRLGFRVAGKITRRAIEAGQRVAAGQLLAQLDAQDYRLAADAARAQVRAAATQRDLAAADLRRFEALRAQNFISGAELERREAQFKAAQATLEQAQAQLAAQGNQAAYTQLLADAPGVVTAIEAEVGQVVSAGASVVRVAQDGPRDVVFAVPEDRVAMMRLGTPLTVRAWQGDQRLQGAVREVAASADPVTRTYAVKLALSSGEAPPLGATVYVTPPAAGAAAAQAIKLPTSALRQEGQASAVWVYEPASKTVRSQPVQIATVDGNDAVLAAGLQPGQQVVVAGVHVLSPGQKVTVYQPKAALAQAGADAAARGPAAPASPAAR